MQDLAVLTPPLLICAAVIIAIIAFLRHEMGRSRAGHSAPGDEISAAASEPAAEADADRCGGADAPQAPRGDMRPGR